MRKIKKAIINHPNLWYNGITDKGATTAFDFISIQQLKKSRIRKKGIKWTETEVKEIFYRLKESYSKIKKRAETSDSWLNYSSLLEEMLYFLENEKTVLIDEFQFIEEINELYIQQRGYNSIKEGISGNDKSNVVWALNELSKIIYEQTKINNIELIRLILNKLLLQAEPALSACLIFISQWVLDFSNDRSFINLKGELLDVIKKYNSIAPKDIDRPFLHEKLICLAMVLKKWGVKDPVIEELSKDLKTSRFNNVRYNLPVKLKEKKVF